MKLVVENLGVERGERRIIEGLAFEVSSGEALVITGPNGSGKSTMLKALAGYLRPSAGTITLLGGNGEKSVPEQCHYLAHSNALKLQLSVRENLEFWQHYLGMGEPVEAALEAVGLPGIGDIPAGYLSAGQKRRVAIARLIAAFRPVWLVDEPTAALDASSECRFAAIVERHLSNGGIVLAATHQPLGLEAARVLEMRALTAGLIK